MRMDEYNNDIQILANVNALKKELLESKLILTIKLARLSKRIEKCDLYIDHINEKHGENYDE